MGDHFEHVAYRYRQHAGLRWEWANLEQWAEMEPTPSDRYWQVERLYRRKEGEDGGK